MIRVTNELIFIPSSQLIFTTKSQLQVISLKETHNLLDILHHIVEIHCNKLTYHMTNHWIISIHILKQITTALQHYHQMIQEPCAIYHNHMLNSPLPNNNLCTQTTNNNTQYEPCNASLWDTPPRAPYQSIHYDPNPVTPTMIQLNIYMIHSLIHHIAIIFNTKMHSLVHLVCTPTHINNHIKTPTKFTT